MAHAQWQYHQNKNEKVGHTCQSVGVARNMKQNNAEARKDGKEQKKQKKGICVWGESLSLATGDRLGKKRQAHRDSFLLTTVLSLKCRSLCTKIQLCWPQHPKGKGKERTEERHKLWGGEWENKSKIQNRESEFIERRRRREHERERYRAETDSSYIRAAVLNLNQISPLQVFRLNVLEDYRRQILTKEKDIYEKKHFPQAENHRSALLLHTQSGRDTWLEGAVILIKRRGEDWWGYFSLTFITPEYSSSVPSFINWLKALMKSHVSKRTANWCPDWSWCSRLCCYKQTFCSSHDHACSWPLRQPQPTIASVPFPINNHCTR